MLARHLLVVSLSIGCLTACNITDSSVTPPIPTQDQTPDLKMDQGMDQGRLDMPKDMMMDQTSPADQTSDLQDTSPDLPIDMPKDLEPDLDPCSGPTPPPQCNPNALGPGTLISKFVIATDKSCCRDFSGDGSLDNQLGTLLSSLRNIGTDINANVKDAITTGAYLQMLEARNWRDPQNDGALTLGFVRGKDTDQDPNNNLNGMSSFRIFDASFNEMGAPVQSFKSVTVSNSELIAKEGTMTLPMPGLISGGLLLEDVLLVAKVQPNANLNQGGGFGLTDIQISGVLKKETLYGVANQIAQRCECLKQDIFKNDNGRYLCLLEKDVCTQDPTQDCQTVGSAAFCDYLEIANNFADVDTDGDNKADAFSIGINATSVPASLLKDTSN